MTAAVGVLLGSYYCTVHTWARPCTQKCACCKWPMRVLMGLDRHHFILAMVGQGFFAHYSSTVSTQPDHAQCERSQKIIGGTEECPQRAISKHTEGQIWPQGLVMCLSCLIYSIGSGLLGGSPVYRYHLQDTEDQC